MHLTLLKKVLPAGWIFSFVVFSCSQKAEVVMPPVQVNVVKAVQSDVPLYEDFVAQVYGQADVDIRSA